MIPPLLALLALAACKDEPNTDPHEDTAEAWQPDLVCPGDAGCADNSGALEAGAAALSITPTCFETWEDSDADGEYTSSQDAFFDCGCDQLCEGDDGYPGADEGEEDGEFQAVWLAGFGNGRPANSVHDEMWARAIAVQTGDTTVALVALDVVGWFYNDAVAVREAVAAAGVDVDLVIVQATHSHEGPDTLGQWGQRVGKTGVNPDYQAYVTSQAAAAVAEAVAGLEPATLTLAQGDTAAPFGSKGTRNTVRDSRDPMIIDEMVYVAHFAGASGDTIATLVNWGNHPEVLSDENTAITSDFSHYLREAIEDGVTYDSYSVDGTGGVCVYVQGPVGGLMTPLGITVTDGEGVDHSASDWNKAEALGKVVAEVALTALAGGETVSAPTVSLRTQQLYIPVENYAFQAMFLIDVFDRPVYNYDPDENVDEDNTPELLTEVDLVEIGPLSWLTIPGELLPELAIGGYDGSRVNTDEVEFISSSNPNPPDMSQAPEAPYYKDLMPGEHKWILGLANDEIGYLIPPYDYLLDESVPYINQAEGDHYEETNSVGPSAVPRLSETIEQLLGWSG